MSFLIIFVENGRLIVEQLNSYQEEFDELKF